MRKKEKGKGKEAFINYEKFKPDLEYVMLRCLIVSYRDKERKIPI